MNWHLLSLLLMPAAGLIIGAVMLRVVSRDAEREDKRIVPGE